MINALPTKKFYTITFTLIILELLISYACAWSALQLVFVWLCISLLQPTSHARICFLSAWVLVRDFCIASTIITPLIMLIAVINSTRYVRIFFNGESTVVCTGIILFFAYIHEYILALPAHATFFFIPYTGPAFFATLLLIVLLLKYGYMDRWTIAHRKTSSR